MEVELAIKGDLRALRLRPSDVLVVHIEREMTAEHIDSIMRELRTYLNNAGLNNATLLTGPGVSIGVQD